MQSDSQTKKPLDLVESFSGVRGIYGKGITEELLKEYLFAYLTIFPEKKERFLVASDTRPSSLPLKKSALSFLKEIGAKEVVDAGVVPVQVAQLSVIKLKCLGGVYLTASHNEPEYNGFKFLKEDGAILYASQAEKIITLVNRGQTPVNLVNFKGGKQTHQIILKKEKEAIELYCKYVLEKLGEEAVEKIRKAKPKILFDPNGGSAITILKKLAKDLNLQAHFVNDKPGIFNRLVEPKAESLSYLEKYFTNSDYEFAAGFDCDADRVEFIIDPVSVFAKQMGSLVNGNYVLALACDCLLEGTKNQIVVTNDVTSYLVRDVIKKHQAIIKEVEVGETIIVQEMEKQNSIIGGEGSNGGVIIPPIKCRDGIMTTMLLLKMITQRGINLSDVLSEYPKYFSSQNKISCQPERAIAVKKKLEEHYKNKGYLIKKTGDETGGLKADFDKNSFIWFRLSKTEPGCFRVYAETDTSQGKANNLAKQALDLFEKFK